MGYARQPAPGYREAGQRARALGLERQAPDCADALEWLAGWDDEDARIAAASAQRQERLDARVDRLRERAAKLRGESSDRARRSLQGLPDNGQPILVGHHSERRHRAAIDRAHANMGKALELQAEAERAESRADAASSSTAISSDDPDALAKLRAKLAEMEAERESYKEHNRKARKEKREQLPSYKLTNLGANIRRVQQRIKELEQALDREPPADVECGAWSCTWDRDENRIRVFSPRPTQAERKERAQMFKSAGFVWSRTHSAWQRQATLDGWHKAVAIVEKMGAP
jgi:DNA repair exonuclease SbcCD ATPase subunit